MSTLARLVAFVAGVVVLALPGACASPALPPADAATVGARVRIDGPHGPLSPAAEARILARLKAAGQDSDIFERHLAYEQEITGTPLAAGNRVTLLQDGPATYEALHAALAAAAGSIDMESYIIEDDEVGQRFAVDLAAAAQRGVVVNLVYDSVGSLGTSKAYFEALRAHGVNVLEFNPVNPLAAHGSWEVNRRDHRKLTIVDGKAAFVGGINISSVYSGGSHATGPAAHPGRDPAVPWRDTDLEVEGPAVADFQRLFMDTWQRQKGPPLAPADYFPPLAAQGDAVVRAIGGTPDEPYSQIYATLVSAIRSASSSIVLANAYFDPDPQLLGALVDAARRGVDVRILVPGVSDTWVVMAAGRRRYGELLEAGAKLYVRRNALMHAKTTLIDGVWCAVGSTNLDWRSFLHNDEVDAVVLSARLGDRMREAFERDVAQSEPLTLVQWRARPVWQRLQEIAAGMWEYWL